MLEVGDFEFSTSFSVLDNVEADLLKQLSGDSAR
jgi:hypothetical protein